MVEKNTRKIVVIGSKGMLGTDMATELSRHSFQLHSFDRDEVDITKPNQIRAIFGKIRPVVVINCAAYTDVDGSESHRKEAFALNAGAVRDLAIACREINALLVHYSTDYVFNGKSKKGYREDGKKDPINYYGKTKSIGEDYLSEDLKEHYLIRTSWLFGENGKNFIEAIKKKANEQEIRVVDDQRGSPTYTKDLAKATVRLIVGKYPFGTYHLTNSGVCTWHEFAKEVLAQIGSNAKVIAIKSIELKRAAKRPICSILLNTKFKSALPSWKDAVRRYIGGSK